MIFVHLSVPHNPVEVTKGIVVYRATDYLHLKAPWRMAMKQLLKRELRSATSVFKSLTKLLSTVGHTRAAASYECVQSMLRKPSSPLLFFVSCRLNVYSNPLLSARYAGWAIIWKHSNIMKDTDITIFRDCTNECGVCWPLPQPPLLVLWQSLDAGVGRCLVHKSSLVCVSEGNLPMGSISCVWQLLYKGELVSQPPNHLLTRNSKFVVRKC